MKSSTDAKNCVGAARGRGCESNLTPEAERSVSYVGHARKLERCEVPMISVDADIVRAVRVRVWCCVAGTNCRSLPTLRSVPVAWSLLLTETRVVCAPGLRGTILHARHRIHLGDTP